MATLVHQVSESNRYCYDFPRPAVTVDIATFTFTRNELQLLLITRKADPFAGCWALPGGFVEMDEDLKSAAQRELAEETGLHNVDVEQLHTFGAPDRDPRSRAITVAHLALVGPDALERNAPAAADDAASVQWWNAYALPAMAFDHNQVSALALTRLRAMFHNPATACRLLPASFTLSELQRVHECVLNQTLDKRNFRRKVLDMDLVEATGEFTRGDHRPARLYRLRNCARA